MSTSPLSLAPTSQPNILSPHSRGHKLEGVWPTLFWGPERLPEIERKLQNLTWAQKLFLSLVAEADAICSQPPALPIEPIGWRHDYYSPETAEHLVFNPSKAEHRDPISQVQWTGEPFRKAWALLVHERTYRLMRNVACLYRLTGEQRYGEWAALGLKQAAVMFSRIDFREKNNRHALYFQTLYDSQVLTLIANTCALLQGTSAYTDQLHAEIVEKVFEASMPYQIDFLKKHGAHNMTCYVDACLAFTGTLLERTDWLALAVQHPAGGFAAMLKNGLARDENGAIDGFWNESTFYHFYAACPLLSQYALMQSSAWPRPVKPLAEGIAPDTENALVRMLLAPAEMSDSQLRLALFGDLGAPRHMKLSLYRHLYEMGAGVLHDSALQKTLGLMQHSGTTRASLEALAFGPDHVESVAPTPVSLYLPATGAVFLRDKSFQAYVKCGLPHHGHDHADKLTFGLTANGTPIVADLGTAGYAERDYYTYCRSTVAHSLILVDDDERQAVEKADLQGELANQKAVASLAFGAEGPHLKRELALDAPFTYLKDTCTASEAHLFTWLLHPYGSASVVYAGETEDVGDIPPLPEHGSFAFLTNRHSLGTKGPVCVEWLVAEGLWLRGWFWADSPFTCTLAKSPGNPRPDYRTTLAIRCRRAKVTISAALEVYDAASSMPLPPLETFAKAMA